MSGLERVLFPAATNPKVQAAGVHLGTVLAVSDTGVRFMLDSLGSAYAFGPAPYDSHGDSAPDVGARCLVAFAGAGVGQPWVIEWWGASVPVDLPAPWAANTKYRAGQRAVLPTGGVGYSPAARMSRSSFDATERAAWTFLPGGHYERITTSGDWTKPTGISNLRVKLVGGGAAGNGGGSALTSGGVSTQVGGVGGGAGVVDETELVPASSTLTFTIGAGGTGGLGAAANGNAGSQGTAGGRTSVTDGSVTLKADGGSIGQATPGNSTAGVNPGCYGFGANLNTGTASIRIPGCGGSADATKGYAALPIGLTTGGGGGGPASATQGGAGGNVATAAGVATINANTTTGTVNGGTGANGIKPGHGGAGGGGGAPAGTGGAGGNGVAGYASVRY